MNRHAPRLTWIMSYSRFVNYLKVLRILERVTPLHPKTKNSQYAITSTSFTNK